MVLSDQEELTLSGFFDQHFRAGRLSEMSILEKQRATVPGELRNERVVLRRAGESGKQQKEADGDSHVFPYENPGRVFRTFGGLLADEWSDLVTSLTEAAPSTIFILLLHGKATGLTASDVGRTDARLIRAALKITI